MSSKLKQEYYLISQEYDQSGWQQDTSSGLLNLYTNQPIITQESSSYYKRVEQWMEATCLKYEFSRMIIPVRVPNNQ